MCDDWEILLSCHLHSMLWEVCRKVEELSGPVSYVLCSARKRFDEAALIDQSGRSVAKEARCYSISIAGPESGGEEDALGARCWRLPSALGKWCIIQRMGIADVFLTTLYPSRNSCALHSGYETYDASHLLDLAHKVVEDSFPVPVPMHLFQYGQSPWVPTESY